MFSQLSVCHSFQGGSHMIITHDALEHGYPSPLPSRYQTSGLTHLPHPLDTRHKTYPLLLTSGGYHWRPVHTSSLQNLPHSPNRY